MAIGSSCLKLPLLLSWLLKLHLQSLYLLKVLKQYCHSDWGREVQTELPLLNFAKK